MSRSIRLGFKGNLGQLFGDKTKVDSLLPPPPPEVDALLRPPLLISGAIGEDKSQDKRRLVIQDYWRTNLKFRA